MTQPAPRIAVLIVAAGRGTRMGGPVGKLWLRLGEAPVLVHSVAAFHQQPAIGRIGIVARRADFGELDRNLGESGRWGKLLPWIEGGAERQESVYLGLQALAGDPPELVLVHDGARPLVSSGLIGRVLAALADHPAVVPTLALTDTVRRFEGARSAVVERAGLFRCQTPQGFRWRTLADAHAQARARGLGATDEAALVEAAGGAIHAVAGESRNLKLTQPGDLELARWLLDHPDWGGAPPGATA
ncbi:MAG: 2-C-methyl-D-erythritol 4-phosphate cytidylyltransferase [Candidatus Lambdaproteobacteria bacterium]|nr:2-C-methyl-D-erythritol 4-phosphate cytidylyltransferase [Candidatus Lambdaproteobacteria bacterium]